MRYEINLRDALKGYTLDQDKLHTPEETVRRFKNRLRRVNLDILEDTVRIDTGRLDIPVYCSICGKDAEKVIGTRKQMGKGATPLQSEASAVMELAERFSFFSFNSNRDNFLLGTCQGLAADALSLDAVALSVHDRSEDRERAMEVFRRLPLRWTRAYNLTRREEVLIPFDWFYAINEFNGTSAGNCPEEAILQGICEVVERHVSSLISRDRRAVPALDMSTVTDPLVQEMIGKYARAGIRLRASDFTLSMGIPTVGVLAHDPATFPDRSEIVWTAGTATDPQKALNRALTEVAQLGGDFNTGSRYVASGLPKLKTIEEADFILNTEATSPVTSLPDLSDPNLKIEVEKCLSALAKRNLEVLVVDTTHPDLGIPSYYTIIPGAHFRERAEGTSVGLFSAKLIAERGDPAWAASELERMDALLPGKYYVKFFLGLTLFSQAEPARAIDCFQEALKADPKDQDIPSIFSYMGQCLKDLGRYRDAIHALEKGAEYDGERTDIHNLMGFCFYKLGEYDRAIDCFRKVIALNPGSAIDYANIASNYREMGDTERAIQYYRFALEMDPTIDFARENLEKLEKSGLQFENSKVPI
ncbi:MAG: YcaO-like family protein [Deltaproteobacteria bacterium]|nr:YcaO-like family protein [Deltaproteobacteria bacterium]